jgi:DNA-binding transcriptional regulator YdaS (Cro superfamily)
MTTDTALIKALMEHGEQKKIAASLGVAEPTVSNVITGAYRPRTDRGRKTLRRVQVAVARAIGKRVDEVFGQAA